MTVFQNISSTPVNGSHTAPTDPSAMSEKEASQYLIAWRVLMYLLFAFLVFALARGIFIACRKYRASKAQRHDSFSHIKNIYLDGSHERFELSERGEQKISKSAVVKVGFSSAFHHNLT